jgi:hypothetical protein
MRAGKKAATEQVELSSQQALMSPGNQLLPTGSGEEAVVAMRNQISMQLRENPEQVRQLFTTWLSEDR